MLSPLREKWVEMHILLVKKALQFVFYYLFWRFLDIDSTLVFLLPTHARYQTKHVFVPPT